MVTKPNRPARRGGVRIAALALLLASAAWPAGAQQSALRGEVSEDAINAQLLKRGGVRRGQEATQPTETYRPASAGAIPDEAGEPLFDPPSADDDDDDETPLPAIVVRGREDDADPDEAAASDPAPPVPEEDTTGTIRQETLDSLDEEANVRLETENARIEAIESRDGELEADPYAPLGIRVGTFDVNAEFDQGLRATTNADSSPDGGSAVLSETQLRLNAFSDWSRHAATLNAYGIVRKTLSGDEISEAEGGVDATLRADLADGFTANAALGYSVRPESADAPVVVVNTEKRPLRHDFDAEIGLRKDVGKARLGIAGTLDRSAYADAEILGGGEVSQEERNSTLATVQLRAGYEISPAVTPFVEAEIGRRFYDVKVDTNGYARSADRLALRGGAEIDLGEKLSGEFSAGWLTEDFDDERLVSASGLALDAALNWSPERDTLVALTAASEVEGTTTPGESGSVRYSGNLAVTRNVRSNLTLGASAGIAWRDYVDAPDHELTLSAEATATWWFNRYMGVNGRLRHESFRSTLPNRDSETSSVYLGLRLQR